MSNGDYYQILNWIDDLEPRPNGQAYLTENYRRCCGAAITDLFSLVDAIIAGDIHYQHEIDGYLRRGLITEGEARDLAERAKLPLEPGGQV